MWNSAPQKAKALEAKEDRVGIARHKMDRGMEYDIETQDLPCSY